MRGYFQNGNILFSFGIICGMATANIITMDKEFQRILQVVSDVTGLAPCEILCKRRFQETIDARWLMVQLMRDEGFYSSRIADYLSMTTRNVNHILFGVSMRLEMGDKMLGKNLERARKLLRNNKEISPVCG